MTCVRRAWLTLPDGRSIALEGRGYFCSNLDLGMPEVREVTNNRPDHNGTNDRTTLMGSRLVSANIVALAGAGARIDEVAAAFGPFMAPGNRPTLHYVLDRGANEERTMVVRGSGYSWPVVGTDERDIQLQWVAPDPAAYGAVTHIAAAWTGSTIRGRVYNRNYPWSYPAGSSSSANAVMRIGGDLPVSPYLRLYGPISAPWVDIVTAIAPVTRFRLTFLGTARIDAGHFVGIDCDKRTVYLDDDPRQSWLPMINWPSTQWPYLAPSPTVSWIMSVGGQNTSHITQVQATWNERFLS
jgi:hypothetical protein